MAGEVVVDALPYIDQGYDEPGVREAVSSFNFLSISRNFPYKHKTFFRLLLWWKKNVDVTDPLKTT